SPPSTRRFRLPHGGASRGPSPLRPAARVGAAPDTAARRGRPSTASTAPARPPASWETLRPAIDSRRCVTGCETGGRETCARGRARQEAGSWWPLGVLRAYTAEPYRRGTGLRRTSRPARRAMPQRRHRGYRVTYG